MKIVISSMDAITCKLKQFGPPRQNWEKYINILNGGRFEKIWYFHPTAIVVPDSGFMYAWYNTVDVKNK